MKLKNRILFLFTLGPNWCIFSKCFIVRMYDPIQLFPFFKNFHHIDLGRMQFVQSFVQRFMMFKFVGQHSAIFDMRKFG